MNFWDNKYKEGERVWGGKPSELAVVAVEHLLKHELHTSTLSILDIGCGYGRDAEYFSRLLKCRVLGIDTSKKAIDIARDAFPGATDVEFRCCDFTEVGGAKYDVVFISNVYHFLRREEREKLRETVINLLIPGGLMFLSTLSINDLQDYGGGVPVPEEPNSFEGEVYLHFCSRSELMEEFNFLKIKKLYEHEYYEHHSTGEVHHHISWILIGEY